MNVPATPTLTSTDLAFERTYLAHERTLMAWVRTATSLISFGFTIYKFFDYVKDDSRLATTRHLFGPREFALAMITIGLFSLFFAIIEHRQSLKSLRDAGGRVRRSLAFIAALLVAVLGIGGLWLVIFRL